MVLQGVRGGVECSTGCSGPVVVQGVRGGLECSMGCSVPEVVQGVRGGVECSTGCSGPVVVQGVRGGLECSMGCSVPEVVQGVRERVQNPLEHDLNSLTLPPAAYVRIYLAGNKHSAGGKVANRLVRASCQHDQEQIGW